MLIEADADQIVRQLSELAALPPTVGNENPFTMTMSAIIDGEEILVRYVPAEWRGALLHLWAVGVRVADSLDQPVALGRVRHPRIFGTEDESDGWDFDAALQLDRNHREVLLVTSTGGPSAVPIGPAPSITSGALDEGRNLLLPISVRELEGLEPILAILWNALEQKGLSTVHERQIMAMAELIAEVRQSAEPNESERWTLVGVIRGALKYLLREVPKDVLAWWKLIDLLRAIDWTNVTIQLRHERRRRCSCRGLS